MAKTILSEAQKMLLPYLENVPPKYRDGNLLLAYYASVVGVFTPDMLYQMLATFPTYQLEQESHIIHYIAVSDLLLSDLCTEVSHELFEMDEDVRKLLKNRPASYFEKFKALPNKKEIAAFAYLYANKFFNHPRRKSLKSVITLESLSIIDPKYTGFKIAESLQKFSQSKDTSIEEIQLLLHIAELEDDLGG